MDLKGLRSGNWPIIDDGDVLLARDGICSFGIDEHGDKFSSLSMAWHATTLYTLDWKRFGRMFFEL